MRLQRGSVKRGKCSMKITRTRCFNRKANGNGRIFRYELMAGLWGSLAQNAWREIVYNKAWKLGYVGMVFFVGVLPL